MTDGTSRRGALAVAVLLAAASLAVWAPATGGSTADAGPDDAVTTTAFRWASPKNLTGTLAVHIQIDPQIDPGAATECRTDIEAEGTVREDIPVLLWEQHRTDHVWSYDRTSTGEPVHAHAAGAGTGPATPWDHGPYETGAGGITGMTGDEVFNITAVAFGLENRPDQDLVDRPMRINVTCDDPFTYSLQASRQAVGFTEQSFTDGGAGISSRLVHSVDVQKNATLKAGFDTEIVRVQAAYLESRADVDGRLGVHHPNGTTGWAIEEDLRWGGDRQLVDGPGDYTLDLSLEGEGYFEINGVLAGLDPVDSLDEVV